MSVHAAIRAHIKEYNSDLALRSWISGGMGIATSLAVFVVLALVCHWIFFWGPWLWITVGLFLAFMAASIWAVRRGHDPDEGLDPFSNDELALMVATWALTDVLTTPRQTVAGFSGILMHGPACLAEAMSLRRRLLPSDAPTLQAAGGLLELAARRGSLGIDDARPAASAAGLLLKLHLLRAENAPSIAGMTRGVLRAGGVPAPVDPKVLRLVPTQKGREVLMGAQPGGAP